MLREPMQNEVAVGAARGNQGDWDASERSFPFELRTGEKCIWSAGRECDKEHFGGDLPEHVQRIANVANGQAKFFA